MSATQTTLKGETMTQETIKNALAAANVGCSVKRIAELLEIDAPSEVLRQIKEICWEMVDAEELTCTTITETEEQFFSVA